ncbi:MAG: 4Fe-4S binding protein [Cetobacterium sp.]|uniref:Pyruvate ferredoxin oxidoreductase delta subunit n=1 Tax=Cetobacterium ceti TaxID=180163 RepID=A0A1T4NCC5_9FUSO|nr:4Fe-4S binding protein [Cetobacterium ceti]MCJ8342036.1 4Fe-4S binding protein [Cetobacterium sp.]SJZ76952.1 pyruvate ferredoxin oxidoreductase delta subunit [Cetobacterium ceti]
MKTKNGILIDETIKWQDITPGGIVYDAGGAETFRTGDWRSMKPVFIEDKCKQCLLCVPVCPDSSIPVTDGKRLDFDMDHCKGCGICYKVCPFGAIEFIKD